MKLKQFKRISKIARNNRAWFLFFGVLGVVLCSGVLLESSTDAVDVPSGSKEIQASVTVSEAACSISGDPVTEHKATVVPGKLTENIGETKMYVNCNSSGGFAIYALGMTNGELGNNRMVSDSGGTIESVGNPPAGTSYWQMKVTTTGGSEGSYMAIPENPTVIVAKEGGVESEDAVASSTYRVYASSSQLAGSYDGQVEYILVQPYTGQCPEGFERDGSSGPCVPSAQ